ncbi:MAG TPA: hypothetical protein VEF06_13785 [Bryobacteraceae bacterium]|nr:hypothetical protein [Bryobacteraceae bacterium]
MARFLIRLYPAQWRARYGEEFQALLEDAPPRWSSLFDLFGGAMKMQLSSLSFRRRVLLLSAAGLFIGFGGSYLVTPQYASQAAMSLAVAHPGAAPEGSLPGMYMRLETEVTSRTTLSAIIQDPRLDLYKNLRRSEPLEDVIESMRHDIRIEPVEHPGMSSRDWVGFVIRFQYDDPHKTQQTVQALVTKFQEANFNGQRTPSVTAADNDEMMRLEVRVAELERKLGIEDPANSPQYYENLAQQRARSGSTGFQLNVLDAPSLPEQPVKPNRAIFAASGFGAGVTLALLFSLIRGRTTPVVALPA